MTHANLWATIAFLSAIFSGVMLIINEIPLLRITTGLLIISWLMFKVAFEIDKNEEN